MIVLFPPGNAGVHALDRANITLALGAAAPDFPGPLDGNPVTTTVIALLRVGSLLTVDNDRPAGIWHRDDVVVDVVNLVGLLLGYEDVRVHYSM